MKNTTHELRVGEQNEILQWSLTPTHDSLWKRAGWKKHHLYRMTRFLLLTEHRSLNHSHTYTVLGRVLFPEPTLEAH